MAKEFSSYQRKIVNEYYKNIDKIAIAGLQELVSRIYLADSEAKKERLWKQVETYLEKLKIPPAVAQNILQKRDVEILAKNLNDWLR